MKKMNFLSLDLGGWNVKKVLMTFSLFLLFGFGFYSANAQYVSQEEAISILSQEVVSLDKNMDALINAGNTAAVQRAEFKIRVLKSMVESIEEGNSVSKVIEMTIGTANGTTSLTDAQLSNKQGTNQWLIDDIIEMLSL